MIQRLTVVVNSGLNLGLDISDKCAIMVHLIRKGNEMSQENMMRDALGKFADGEGLTDQELEGLLDFFEGANVVLEELMVYFNLSYGFACNDVRRNLERLRCFKRSRADRVSDNVVSLAGEK